MEEAGPDRDEPDVSQFIERFSAALAEMGMPRMPARVFVALLSTDSGCLTSAELVDLLRISPAAVSGAIQYLVQVNLASREREPGSRRDVYRVYEDVWFELISNRLKVMGRWADTLQNGIDAVGDGTPAGTRLAETARFFTFMNEQVPGMMAAWHESRAQHGT